MAGGFQLLTRPPFGPWLRRLLHTPVETRLSAPALETLAVVAYRQPVLRADIEAIRGVQCGDILRQLMDRDLVRIISRADDLGRPLLYGTTKRFLQIFGLRHLDELPQAAALRRARSPRRIEPKSGLAGREGSRIAADPFANERKSRNLVSRELFPRLAGRYDGRTQIPCSSHPVFIDEKVLQEEFPVTTLLRRKIARDEMADESFLTLAEAARRHDFSPLVDAAEEVAAEDEEEDDWDD